MLSGVSKPEQGAAQDKEMRRERDASDGRDVFKPANDRPKSLTDRDAIHHNVWIVAAPFYAIRFINDTSYCSEDNGLEAERLTKPERKSSGFYKENLRHCPRHLVV